MGKVASKPAASGACKQHPATDVVTQPPSAPCLSPSRLTSRTPQQCSRKACDCTLPASLSCGRLQPAASGSWEGMPCHRAQLCRWGGGGLGCRSCGCMYVTCTSWTAAARWQGTSWTAAARWQGTGLTFAVAPGEGGCKQCNVSTSKLVPCQGHHARQQRSPKQLCSLVQ